MLMFGWENKMAIDEKLLEIREFNGIGYQPLINFKSWRVAIMNYIDEIQPERIKTVERHKETDEVFVLLQGKGILFLGDGELELERFYPQVMEPGKIYNVKKNVWHSIVLTRDGSVLIVENQDTDEKNTDYSPILPRHGQLIMDAARREQPEEWEK
jgi:mannose-6-phosphate isomerase-like protein (cupin superfamily)